MCFLRVLDVSRPVIVNDIILLRYEHFKKLKDENYIRVLSTDKKWDEISKSYFYFIVDKLKKMSLLLDNAIAFKLVLPYETSNNTIILGNGIMYITNKKQLVYFDVNETTYTCKNCPVISSCVPVLKQIAYELGIKIRNDNPNLAWHEILKSIKETFLDVSLSFRMKIGEIPIADKICCKEEKNVEASRDL